MGIELIIAPVRLNIFWDMISEENNKHHLLGPQAYCEMTSQNSKKVFIHLLKL